MLGFGKKINLKDAEQMYISALEIKARTADKIKEAFSNDIEAQRFYLGTEMAYVFSREFIDQMLKMIGPDTTTDKKGVVLYIGSKYDQASHRNGRPTLMAFAYDTYPDKSQPPRNVLNLIDPDSKPIKKIPTGENRFFIDVISTSGTAEPVFIDNTEFGFEHPGGGGKGVSVLERLEEGLPVSFYEDEIQPGIF